MPIDPEQVRVDLLKFRRKAYLSYEEGSIERKNFLKLILQNELKLAESDTSQNLLEVLVEGKGMVLHNAIKSILWAVSGFVSSTLLFFLTVKYTWFSYLFLLAGSFSLYSTIHAIQDYFRYKKSFDNVEQYSSDMKRHMKRISNDIKRLDGPHGY